MDSRTDFNQIAAFKKQKELLLLKRNRTDRLIQLLGCLERGEKCMSFKEFDLSEYINALETFKTNNTDTIIKHWGNIDNFDLFINKLKTDESEVAKLAIKQFGSIERYTEAMKYNLEHFSEIMEHQMSYHANEVVQQSEELFTRLTSDLTKDVTSDEIQLIVREIEHFAQENTKTISLGKLYFQVLIKSYSNDYIRAITDTKYGSGAADYIRKAFQYYANSQAVERE